MIRSGVVTLMLTALFSSPADAQFDKILSSVTEVTISASCWNTRGALNTRKKCGKEVSGYGIELMFRLPIETAIVEVALGYSEFTGFTSTDPAIELRGAVRENPSLSVYTTFRGRSSLQPYLGVRSGFLELKHVQATLPDPADPTLQSAFHATAQMLQVGVVAGAAAQVRNVPWLFAFAEVAATRRKFGSVQWAHQSGNKIKAVLPPELDFSGLSYAAGLQLRIPQVKK